MKAPDKSARTVLSGAADKRAPRALWRRLTLAAAGVALAGAASGAVWVAYNQGLVAGTETAAPLIRASVDETRRRPADPGGMDVPNRDKLVFDRIAPDAGQVRLERLLPPPEAPLPRPVAPGANGAGAVPAATSVLPAAPRRQVAAPAADIKAFPQPLGAPLLAKMPEKLLVAEIPPPPVAVVPPPPVAATLAKAPPVPAVAPAAAELAAVEPAAGAPSWRVQIAAMRTEEAAEQVWRAATAKYNDLLGELRLNVEEVTLAERGKFYRVQAGPLADRKQADALCAALKIRDQGCLVVRP